jgi:hypothetical protein
MPEPMESFTNQVFFHASARLYRRIA